MPTASRPCTPRLRAATPTPILIGVGRPRRGRARTTAGAARPNPTTNYFYANGHRRRRDRRPRQPHRGRGPYDPAKIIGEAVPADLVLDHVVQAGETLQSIAAQVYGNPSLWFVIADANGLSGSETLREGMHLKIPNTVQIGRITDETHTIYREGEIVGSKLPNLKSPPPPQSSQQAAGADNCAAIGAIIVTVVIAITAIAATIAHRRPSCTAGRHRDRPQHDVRGRGVHRRVHRGCRRGHRFRRIGGDAGLQHPVRRAGRVRLEAGRDRHRGRLRRRRGRRARPGRADGGQGGATRHRADAHRARRAHGRRGRRRGRRRSREPGHGGQRPYRAAVDARRRGRRRGRRRAAVQGHQADRQARECRRRRDRRCGRCRQEGLVPAG